MDGDGRIDFFEFVRALGEPESSQDCEDEDEDTLGSSAPSLEPSEKTSFIKTVITSPVESPVAATAPLKSSIDSDVPVSTSAPLPPSTAVSRPTGRQLNAPKTRSTRPYRSVSPDPTSLQKPQTGPMFERLRSPSLKEAGSLNFLAQKAQERRPSLRTCYVSDEVARISRASFRESYNALAKPNQKSNPDSPSAGSKSPFALDFSSLEALRESYRKLACLTNELNGNGSAEATVRDEDDARLAKNNRRDSRSTAAEQSFDIESDYDFEHSDGDADDLDSDARALSYQAIPGFGPSAFYLSKVQLDFPNG